MVELGSVRSTFLLFLSLRVLYTGAPVDNSIEAQIRPLRKLLFHGTAVSDGRAWDVRTIMFITVSLTINLPDLRG